MYCSLSTCALQNALPHLIYHSLWFRTLILSTQPSNTFSLLRARCTLRISSVIIFSNFLTDYINILAVTCFIVAETLINYVTHSRALVNYKDKCWRLWKYELKHRYKSTTYRFMQTMTKAILNIDFISGCKTTIEKMKRNVYIITTFIS